MNNHRLTTHSHWFARLICYFLIFVVALRRNNDLILPFSFALILLAAFTVLYASEHRLSQSFKWYPRVYFTVQTVIILALGSLQEYQDTWALLFVVLGYHMAARCSPKEASVWAGLFVIFTLVPLSFEFGLISGLGRGAAYIVIGILLITYDIQYSQHEDALAESQVLLAELKEAHQRLEEYAVRAEQLAAVQERNRIIQELHDSVGQKIFAIQLAAETTRLMLGKDLSGAVSQIDDLQEQTQSALGQMRQLISQWRPT